MSIGGELYIANAGCAIKITEGARMSEQETVEIRIDGLPLIIMDTKQATNLRKALVEMFPQEVEVSREGYVRKC